MAQKKILDEQELKNQRIYDKMLEAFTKCFTWWLCRQIGGIYKDDLADMEPWRYCGGRKSPVGLKFTSVAADYLNEHEDDEYVRIEDGDFSCEVYLGSLPDVMKSFAKMTKCKAKKYHVPDDLEEMQAGIVKSELDKPTASEVVAVSEQTLTERTEPVMDEYVEPIENEEPENPKGKYMLYIITYGSEETHYSDDIGELLGIYGNEVTKILSERHDARFTLGDVNHTAAGDFQRAIIKDEYGNEIKRLSLKETLF